MTHLKYSLSRTSLAIGAGLMLVGLAAGPAMSQDPPPRDQPSGWDNGPAPAHPNGPRRADGPRQPQSERGDAQSPPSGPAGEMDDGSRGDRPRGPNPRRRDPRRDGEGDRPSPHEGPGGPGGPDGNGPPQGRRDGPPGPPMDFEGLKTRDPELYTAMQQDRVLEQQTRELAGHYREASADDKAKIKDKLAETVAKHFAVRQQLRMLEVKRIEQQVKQLREKIEQREKNRKEIVAKRVTELTGSDDEDHF